MYTEFDNKENNMDNTLNTDIWQQIDLIHEQNCTTGYIRLKISPDLKEAILESIEEDFDFRDNLRNLLKE